MTLVHLVLTALLVVAAGCGVEADCERYADKEIQCGNAEDHEAVREALKDQCVYAMDVPDSPMKAMTVCARKSRTCVDYAHCLSKVGEP